jgi:hypothetical protein
LALRTVSYCNWGCCLDIPNNNPVIKMTENKQITALILKAVVASL